MSTILGLSESAGNHTVWHSSRSESTKAIIQVPLMPQIWFWRSVTLKRPLAVVTWVMASDLDFSPPEVPEPTFLENLLRYGLFLGAIFQLICVLAIIVPIPKSHDIPLPGSDG
ncbi:Protein MANBAL [Lemmus lemmus]